ncbi:DUF6503 family protein [uncultured Psychroserpens sp.]|uniref:DUF6503 family protein n=1 Tax=uncultured Psychroserpens sp. TaxID=255436 RepID=UPI0026151B25|nr:DUF6503 family protein [uncultured Psychroserpens sp.]
MYKHLFLILLISAALNYSAAQTITGSELLEKVIAYHDPNQKWDTFNGEFYVTMQTPNDTKRVSHIQINLLSEYFSVEAVKDTVTTQYILDKSHCTIALNGKTDLSKAELFSNNLSCDRANLYKNYYTYLYGLPMKLNDKGTIIHDKVERKSFKGKVYLVLKATYDETVGSDVWYFYFDPKTFALEVYQFFKTDEKGKVKHDSGEYILLSEVEVINGIKMPKIRAWYYNKDNAYLGTDTLRQ